MKSTYEWAAAVDWGRWSDPTKPLFDRWMKDGWEVVSITPSLIDAVGAMMVGVLRRELRVPPTGQATQHQTLADGTLDPLCLCHACCKPIWLPVGEWP